jgi:predicted dinucleotide-binding enzyme
VAETLANLVADLGPGAIAATREQAAECDVVIVATNWVNVPEALKGTDWRGRILAGWSLRWRLAHARRRTEAIREKLAAALLQSNGSAST